MKIILSISCLLFSLTIGAQTVYQFNPAFQDNSTYTTYITMSTSAEIIEGPEEMKAMESSMGNSMDMEFAMTTGEKMADASVPFRISYNKMDMVSPMFPDGLPGGTDFVKDIKIHGKFSDGIKMEIDSIAGGNDNPMMTNAISQGIQKMTQSIEFPSEGMKIGDSFDQDLSKTMDIAGMSPNTKMKATYTLSKVEGDIASFEYAITMSGDMAGVMSMTGNGTGVTTYDLTRHFISGMVVISS